jgi:glycerol-3-phosphate dehydrogenase
MIMKASEMWDNLGPEVDVLIVGGGINGCGIARDAARRGLSVALLEMHDFAFGTSSRSSKLVHGGLRYLEQYEFSLVFEAVSERRILLDIAPHIVNPLGFLFPVYTTSKHKLWFIEAGMWLYEGLSLFRSPKRHVKLKPKQVAKEEPALNIENITGAPLYFDCSTDDARLTLENAMDAAGHGAILSTWTKVTGFIKEDGRIRGVEVVHQLTGETKSIRAHAVVNATGPWTDRTIAMSKALDRSLLRPTKGVHIVVPRHKLPVNNAVVCVHPTDKRVLFAIPWNDCTYVGTTDTDFEGDPADVYATAEDVSYLIDAAGAYFIDHPLTRDDIIATWAGLRPLMAPVGAGGDIDESQVSREHQIVIGEDGLITIAGGKLTTFRLMSAEVTDTVVKMLRLSNQVPAKLTPSGTEDNPLPGAVGWPADDDHEHVALQVLDASKGTIQLETARCLANTYGTRGIDIGGLCASDPDLAQVLIEGRPEILAQVDWAVQRELATRISDFMIRRTQLYYRDVDQGLGAAEAVGQRMATLLGWEDARLQEEIAYYGEVVARSRRWRDSG